VTPDVTARLADWKSRSEEFGAERDQLVREANAGGVNIRQIAILSGLSRTTVYKIIAGDGGEDAGVNLDEYVEFTNPLDQRIRQLWGEIEEAKAAGRDHGALSRERNELISECEAAERRYDRERAETTGEQQS
jgi:hypothetical protein